MSMRTIARSSSNKKSANDLANSVLPTPVGPKNRNEPMGRSGSATPARERRTASETVSTARRCPINRVPISRSEERRVGQGWRGGGWLRHEDERRADDDM